MSVVVSAECKKIATYENMLLQNHTRVSVKVIMERTEMFEKTERVVVFIGKREVPASGSASILFKRSTWTAEILLEEAGSLRCHFRATDSDGSVVEQELGSIYVEPYYKPVINSVLSQRSLQNGTLSDDGQFANLTVDYVYSSLNGKNGVRSAVAYIKEKNETTYVKVLSDIKNSTPTNFGGNYSKDKGFDIKVEITDKVGNSVSYVDFLTTGRISLEFYKNLAAAFGKAVEKTDGLELSEKWKFYTHEDVFHDKNVNVGKSITAGGNVTVGGNLTVNGKIIQSSGLRKYNDIIFMRINHLPAGETIFMNLMAFTRGDANNIPSIITGSIAITGTSDTKVVTTWSTPNSSGIIDRFSWLTGGGTSSYIGITPKDPATFPRRCMMYYKVLDYYPTSSNISIEFYGTEVEGVN